MCYVTAVMSRVNMYHYRATNVGPIELPTHVLLSRALATQCAAHAQRAGHTPPNHGLAGKSKVTNPAHA